MLGLPAGPSQLEDWVEYQAGNLTLAVMNPETHGEQFTPIPPGTIGLRVPDVAAAKARSRKPACRSTTSGTPASATARPFAIPPATMLTLHRYAPY